VDFHLLRLHEVGLGVYLVYSVGDRDETTFREVKKCQMRDG